MRLCLVTGFLGSGKTSLILSLAQAAQRAGLPTAILVNEIGEIGIDDQLMRQLSLNVWELLSGCICCTLVTDLVSTLEMLDAEHQIDLVIVEPSGAANPAQLLSALPLYHGAASAEERWIVVLDALRLPMLLEVLEPLITAGIRQADCIVISKIDVASADEVTEAVSAARAINPQAPIFREALNSGVSPELLKEVMG